MKGQTNQKYQIWRRKNQSNFLSGGDYRHPGAPSSGLDYSIPGRQDMYGAPAVYNYDPTPRWAKLLLVLMLLLPPILLLLPVLTWRCAAPVTAPPATASEQWEAAAVWARPAVVPLLHSLRGLSLARPPGPRTTRAMRRGWVLPVVLALATGQFVCLFVL